MSEERSVIVVWEIPFNVSKVTVVTTMLPEDDGAEGERICSVLGGRIGLSGELVGGPRSTVLVEVTVTVLPVDSDEGDEGGLTERGGDEEEEEEEEEELFGCSLPSSEEVGSGLTVVVVVLVVSVKFNISVVRPGSSVESWRR